MLKNIPKSFTPELLKLLMEMGHGEEVLIADGNFPQKSMNCQTEAIYVPVCDISGLLGDILNFFPLDRAVEFAACAMESVKEGQRYGQYSKLIEDNGSKLLLVERFKFYECAKNAVGIIVTADTTKGGNILIKKGVVNA
ncbi:MAG: fucose isomerase [Oscillospiraceae bacterium]|jgi:L-fucose mutarotase|nr:fucose isomerase [Oscillospiraceae bacterium]